VGNFGKDDGPAGDTTRVAKVDHSTTAGAATRMIERLMDAGIDGKGPFDSAQKVADVAIAEHPEADGAIDAMVRSHLKLAAAGGFVTGLGGFVTMPIALPANVLGFYLVATRMVAGIASARGYDIRQPEPAQPGRQEVAGTFRQGCASGRWRRRRRSGHLPAQADRRPRASRVPAEGAPGLLKGRVW